MDCKPNRRNTLAPFCCINSLHVTDLTLTRALLEMRSPTAILNMPHSGPGKSLKLVGYSIVFPNNH